MTAFDKLCIKASLRSGNLIGKRVVTEAQLTQCLAAFLSLLPLTAPQVLETKHTRVHGSLHTGPAEVKVNLSSLAADSWHYPAASPLSETTAGTASASCFDLTWSLPKRTVTN